MSNILRWLTGGRPMTKVCFMFTDVVSGEPVYRFEDTYGRAWMATHRWSFFRVTPLHGADIWDTRIDAMLSARQNKEGGE